MRHLPPDALDHAAATHLRTPTVLMGHGGAPTDGPPQIPISATTLVHEIRPWFKGRMQRGNALVPGSNDQWAAADLAGWLNQSAGHHPNRYWDIERDASIHLHPDQRISLLFNRRSAAAPHDILAVGVRVQSLLVTPGRFAQGVDAELARLQAAALRVPFNVCQRFVLALTSDIEGAAAMRARGFETLATSALDLAMLWREVGG